MAYRVLAVEDSATQADALCMLLEENGYSVGLARSGEAALEQLENESFDIVVTDVVMPGISGYQLCRRIKDDPRTAETPVLLLTTLTDPMDIVRGLEAGADNYITKPYDTEQLLARIRRVLDNRRFRPQVRTSMGVNIEFLGSTFTINSDREQILDLLLSSVEDIVRTNHELEERQNQLSDAHRQLEAYAREKSLEAQTSTERYRALTRDANDAIFLLDPAGTILEANLQASELLGRPLEDLLWRPLSSFMPPDDADSLADQLASLRTTPTLPPTDRVLTTADGRQRLVEFSASGTRVNEDEFILGIARDVTEQREYTNKLRTSQRQLAEAQQIAGLGSWEWHLDTNTLDGSDVLAEIFGTHLEQLGSRWYDAFIECVHPDDRHRVHDSIQHAVRSGGRYDIEFRITRPDGGVRICHARGELVSEEGSAPGRVVGSVQDITARKQAERRIEESEALFRTLIDAAPVGIIEFDVNGNIRIWNTAAEHIMGWSADEVRGAPMPYADPEDRAQFWENWERTLDGENVNNFEVTRRRKDGSPVHLNVSTAPMLTAGEVTGVIGILVDITERKHAEEALRRSEEQLRQAQRMEAIGRLTGGIAHDFNNMLTAIKGSTELLLLDLPPDSGLQEELQEIDRAASRAALLTRQLLAFSRSQVLRAEVIDLNRVVMQLDHMLRRLIGEDVELVTALERDLQPVVADPGQVEQMLMNLVVNARDAMPEGGRIVIETGLEMSGDDEDGDAYQAVLLRVRDTGVGMPPDVQDRIFEPFFTTKEVGKGTGLGLSTVYGIVAQSGGRIDVDSAPGKGTTFTIRLPVAEGEALPPAAPPAQERKERVEAPARASGTVLLVEDEEAVRRLASRILRNSGYSVLEAANGAEALELAGGHEAPIDVLVTDLVMPGMSGSELARTLKGQRPDMRVLLMSGYSAEDADSRYFAPAEFELLEKPFTPRAFTEKLREVLNGQN